MGTSPERHVGPVLHQANGFDVIECEHCRFKHIVPIPSDESLRTLYKESWSQSEERFEWYWRDKEWWDRVHAERLQTFEDLLPNERRRILDVGSGPGLFLLAARERGWQVVGLEASYVSARRSRAQGFEIVEQFVDENTVIDRAPFDVIHCSELVEHLRDPRAFLRFVRRSLAQGGLFAALVPNDYNPLQSALVRADGTAPWWVVPPHHINYFDAASLERLLRSEGFEPTLVEATFPIDLFLMMGVDYRNNETVGRECHTRRMAFERNLEQMGLRSLKRDLYRAFASLGLGREVLVVARLDEQGK